MSKTLIDKSALSVRANGILDNMGITTIEELCTISNGDLCKQRNCGAGTFKEIKEYVYSLGVVCFEDRIGALDWKTLIKNGTYLTSAQIFIVEYRRRCKQIGITHSEEIFNAMANEIGEPKFLSNPNSYWRGGGRA